MVEHNEKILICGRVYLDYIIHICIGDFDEILVSPYRKTPHSNTAVDGHYKHYEKSLDYEIVPFELSKLCA